MYAIIHTHTVDSLPYNNKKQNKNLTIWSKDATKAKKKMTDAPETPVKLHIWQLLCSHYLINVLFF